MIRAQFAHFEQVITASAAAYRTLGVLCLLEVQSPACLLFHVSFEFEDPCMPASFVAIPQY